MAVESFNLDPPPGFRGLHPDLAVRVYTRHLPHWRQEEATYFVTFRLADALPQSKLGELRRWRAEWERKHPEPRSEAEWEQFAREHMRRTDAWMDEGFGDCVFSSRQISDVLANSLLYFQDVRYVVYCYVVMPNHCHVVVKPLPTFELETILDSWKGFVGHEVNRLLGHSGTLWQDESYDRIVRDEEHLFHIVQYIGRNPEKARIEHELWRRWIHPDWERVGWRFLE